MALSINSVEFAKDNLMCPSPLCPKATPGVTATPALVNYKSENSIEDIPVPDIFGKE